MEKKTERAEATVKSKKVASKLLIEYDQGSLIAYCSSHLIQPTIA
jgi:hypothetical protein